MMNKNMRAQPRRASGTSVLAAVSGLTVSLNPALLTDLKKALQKYQTQPQ